MPQPTTTETATLAQIILTKLGFDGPITVGNPATGETTALPPHVAALVRQVLVSYAAGRQPAITENLTEMSPNEAAVFLNVSRTYVMKLVADGLLPTRKVGNHHRIPFADLAVYREQQAARSRAAMDELYKIDRELGLDDLDGPAPELARDER